MVRLTGPAFSLTASGSLAKTLTFATWKGRPYLRQLVIPTNPKSAAQMGVRAMMSFLAKQWDGLTAGEKTSWEANAEEKQISAFNEYVSVNLTRWQLFSPPTQEYPAAEASTPITLTSMTLTGGDGHVLVEILPATAVAIWGFVILRSLAAITSPNWNQVVHVLEADAANAVQWTDAPLDPGTYHYRAAAINDDGIMGTVIADDSAEAT